MYLVTGGTGFLGCYVMRDLLKAGHSVTGFDLFPDLKTLELVAGAEASRHVHIVHGDVTVPAQLLAAVRKFQPQIIVHLASPLPPDSESDVTASLQQIVQGCINVLEAARILGVSKIVWASATSVFGRPERHGGVAVPVPNDAPHYPETLYGIYKSTNERLAELYWQRFGVDSVGLRFCQGYGPGKRRGRPFGYLMFEKAVLGESYKVPYGDDLINWQYIEEMAALVVQASQAPPTQTRIFNTTGHVLPMREAVELLSGMLPQARLEIEPGKAGLVWRFETSRLEEELGFKSRVTVAEGFSRTIATLQAWRQADAW